MLASAAGASVAAQESGTPAASGTVCTTLTAERTEGPYYIEDALLRDDITEGVAGVPLQLDITVMDVTTCQPLTDVAVDIWHCNAVGEYSGVSAGMGNPDTTGQTFLRGIQLTDSNGVANIKTIYPGWYAGRATHIHLKVHVGGAAADGTYEGGTVAHTGQLFFDDALTDQIAQIDPYNTRDVVRTRNDEDNVLAGGLDEPGFLLEMTPVVDGSLADGFVGTVTLGVDPAAISTESGSGSGQGGPPSGGPGDPQGGGD